MTLFNVKPARRIASGFHPDPTICEKPEGGYLMVNSSFEYFPGLPVFESADGEHWTKIGDAMDRASQFPYESMDNNQGIYAPTLRWCDGTYYLIVTNVNTGNMILTSTDPHAGWSDPIWVEGWPGIDPSLFFDDDGKAYICGNEGGGEDEPAGIYLSEIDAASGTVLTERRRICAGITGSNPEGPHLYKRGGTYYLMWAEGGTESGHMENIARADNPYGPYEMYPGNPLITNRSTHLTLQAIGHCDCAHFESDRTLMVFHGTRNNDEYPAQGWVGREPYAVWFDWKDGWPDLADQSYDCALVGDGSSLEQAVAWVTPAIDTENRHRVESSNATDGSATIAVRAQEQDFGLAHGAPLIGTRQTDVRFDFQATLTNPKSLQTGQTGVVVYANAGHYLTLAAHAANNGTVTVEASVHNAGLATTIGMTSLPSAPTLTLVVRGDDRGYHFEARSADNEATVPLGFAPGKVLAFANAGGFTGVLLGVYAHGSGEVAFHDVTYRAPGEESPNAADSAR